MNKGLYFLKSQKIILKNLIKNKKIFKTILQ